MGLAMPADEKTQRVMTRIGVWTPGKCPEYAAFGRYPASCSHGVPWGDHDIPCPDPADPAIIVAMLEWVMDRRNRSMSSSSKIFSVSIVEGYNSGKYRAPLKVRISHEKDYYGFGDTLSAAIIDAIDSLPED